MWGAGEGDSGRVRVLQFDWFVCAFGRVPVSSTITGSESPDHAAAMKDRTQQKMRGFWVFFVFFKGSHTHAHIPVWVFKGCLQLEEERKGRVRKHKT